MQTEFALPILMGAAIVLVFGVRAILHGDRQSRLMVAFGVLTLVGGELWYIRGTAVYPSELVIVSEALLIVVSALTTVLGLELVDARRFAKLVGIHQRTVILTYVVPVALALFGAAYTLIVSRLNVGVMILALLVLVMVGGLAIDILRRSPMRYALRLVGHAVMSQVIGLVTIGIGGAVALSGTLDISGSMYIMELGSLLVVFGGWLRTTLRTIGLTPAPQVSVILVNRDLEVEMTTIGTGTIRSARSPAGAVARYVVGLQRETIKRVFKTGETVLVPSVVIDKLGPGRRFQIEVRPHWQDSNGTVHLVRVVIVDVTAAAQYAGAEQLADLLDVVIRERNYAETYLDMIAHDVANRLQALTIGLDILSERELNNNDRDSLLAELRGVVDSTAQLVADARSKRYPSDLKMSPELIAVREAVERALMVVKIRHPKITIRADIAIDKDYLVPASPMLDMALSMLIHYCLYSQQSDEVKIFARTNVDPADEGRLQLIIGHFLAPELDSEPSPVPADTFTMRVTDGRAGVAITHEIVVRAGGDLTIERREAEDRRNEQQYQFVITLPYAKHRPRRAPGLNRHQ